MGVKGFFKVFPHGDKKTLKDLSGLRIGVDISHEIYRASLGMKSVDGLTDRDGNPTIMLSVLIYNISKYMKSKARGLIYIFDNPIQNKMKLSENKKRSANKNKSKELVDKLKLTNENTERIQQLEKRHFSITTEMIDDIKKLLDFLMIPWIVAPKDYEAEHLGAELMKNKIIDTMMTSDSDTIMFGGNSMMKKEKGRGKPTYIEYRLDNIMKESSLSHEEIVKAGVLLGTDFNIKTRGIGEKTVLKKIKTVELTDEQKISYDYFLSSCPFDVSLIHKSKKVDVDKLIEWMVDDKNFNEKRLRTALLPFLDKK